MRAGRTENEIHAGNRLEVAKLVRDVGHAVVVEHEPRSQLRLGFGELGVGDAALPDAIDFVRGREPHRVERRPSVAVADKV